MRLVHHPGFSERHVGTPPLHKHGHRPGPPAARRDGHELVNVPALRRARRPVLPVRVRPGDGHLVRLEERERRDRVPQRGQPYLPDLTPLVGPHGPYQLLHARILAKSLHNRQADIRMGHPAV